MDDPLASDVSSSPPILQHEQQHKEPHEKQHEQQHEEESGEDDDEEHEERSAVVIDPKKKIIDFQWNKLEEDFLVQLADLQKNEDGLAMEFNQLIEYFTIWAETIHDTDSNRACKRLKTRITKVQLSEESLEQKRMHYVKVVGAFQQALSLLNHL